MESENREILDGVTISDVGGSQYMIQRMPVDSQLLSSELLQHHNGLVVDLGAGDFIPVNYASEDLLPQDLTEEDRNLAAALVAVQLSQQQKQQQMQDSNVVINGNLPLCDDQLTDKTTLSNGYLQIVESDNIYKQNLIPKICFDAREFSPAEVYDRNEDILSIKSEKEIESSTAIHRDSDGDQKSDNRNLKRTLPHKKRLSRKLRKTNNALRKFYKCNLCEQVFHNNEDYTRHQSLCQTTITPINQVLFTCQICTASFHDQLRFFEHLKDHYEPSILVQENANCIIDKQTVDVKRQQPTKHQDTILPLYNCIECNKTFRRQKAYEAHVREFHNKDDLHDFSGSEDLIPDIPTPVQPTMDTKEWYHREDELQATEEDLRELEAQDCVCMQCNQQFQTRAALREHAMTCKEMEEVPPLKVPATEGRKSKKKLIEFKCTECTRVFAHKNSLVYHMRVHTGVRPHTCVECGKSFFAAGALKVHLRLHSGDKPYCCEYCGKHFRQWGDLKYHCMSIHSDHKQYQCDYCGKDFARKYSLIVHRRIHTGEKNYKCEFCCKTFRASSYLQNHRRIHTGEKPHCCDMCGKRFRVRSDMKRHLLTHNRKKAGGGGGGARATPTDPAAVKDEGKEENGIFPDGLPPEDDSMDSKLHSIPSSGIDAPSGGPMQVSQYEQDPLEAIQDNNTLYVMPILIT